MFGGIFFVCAHHFLYGGTFFVCAPEVLIRLAVDWLGATGASRDQQGPEQMSQGPGTRGQERQGPESRDRRLETSFFSLSLFVTSVFFHSCLELLDR